MLGRLLVVSRQRLSIYGSIEQACAIGMHCLPKPYMAFRSAVEAVSAIRTGTSYHPDFEDAALSLQCNITVPVD